MPVTNLGLPGDDGVTARLLHECEVPGRVPPHWPVRPPVGDRLIGPGSITWRINGEIVVLFGWGRAVLLQLAHPLVAAGVADHSSFRGRHHSRLRRLRRTVGAMLDLTFGTREEATRAAQRIDAIHGRVTGHLAESVGYYAAGTPYFARDPELLRWVNATLVDTALQMHELFVGPLSPEEEDRYCEESTAVGSLLGVPDGFLPSTRQALHSYMREMLASGKIAVGDTARDLARSLLAPPLPRLAKPIGDALALPIVGLLPEPIRSAYGLPWDDRHETLLVTAASVSRVLIPRLPPVLHRWPVAK